ncbi:MAG TPA: bifunctional UDP-N-acetylglucosamine diphosphorylase/glucosamine-1-phosphate N-acetyltransferase GlmU [Gammaproteobacteria bacterium]|nr:bifunctional UDP-N-acetylglucosamine diphosphorylase/glucosamine-1-phosphate N-acetyltransferase GlmU [Gammaproteobacteria bacterium]
MTLNIVILAAGVGKRMQSKTPKVLHHLAGKPLIEHVIQTALKLQPAAPPTIIYGHEGAVIQQALASFNVKWVEQSQQLGTGHAVLQALPLIPKENRILILYGDVPLISLETLQYFIKQTPKDAVGIITAHLPNSDGLGRIVRDAKNNITQIIEEKDANEIQRAIQEINSGIYLVPARYLQEWLPTLDNKNAQQEYYLPDIIKIAVKKNIPVHSIQPSHHEEVLGVNDRAQLAYLERFYQHQLAKKLMQRGVTLLDPSRFDVRGELTVGLDVEIDINVIIEGHVTIGNHCTIGPNTVLRDTMIGDHVTIKANSVIEEAKIAKECVIGPFARIRPGTVISEKTHVGNFVEIKNSAIGVATKINHLTYVGDSDVGNHVNIGAGTITCNYDGINKHRTTIKNGAFIGSNAVLIAPVIIGESAYIAAGSAIARDAPAHQLTICRAQARSIDHWEKPKKKEKEK